ncbi:hypothetical protein C3L55_07570, partial [Veillonellaceae bacterium M1-70]|nr:hypothetical protein [Veillonellaceae bacterium M1-70]
MKLSGKQLTTAVLIGLMGISAGGVAMAKPPIHQGAQLGGPTVPAGQPGTSTVQPSATGQPDPAKTTDELIAEIQTNLTNQGKELDKKATKDELEKYATKDEMNDALSKKADASEVTALAAQLAQKANQSDVERDYAKKTDLDAKATKDELKDYAKKTDLDAKATKDELKDYAKKTDLDAKATKDELKDYAKKTDLDAKATKDELKDYAKKTDLDAKATKDELKDYAKKTDLDAKATKDELKDYAKKTDLDAK